MEKVELPDLEYYNVPKLLNEFSNHADEFNILFDIMSCVDSRFNREGNSFHEIFDKFKWHPLDSFRLQCLDIAYDVVFHYERLEEYCRYFIQMYLLILNEEKGKQETTQEEIVVFYKTFMEAFFRGLGVNKSEIILDTHHVYCFRYLLQHLVDNEFTSRRSLVDFDLIATTETVTKDALDMMLNSKSHNCLFKLSTIPIELRKPEILKKLRLLMDKGYLNNLGKPSSTVTPTELSTIAECICCKFGIKGKDGVGNVNWKLFEDFWGKSNLRQSAYRRGSVDPQKQKPSIGEIEKLIMK